MRYTSLLIFVAVVLNISCTKDFLDNKPNKKLVIPSTLRDYQALLDHADLSNNFPFWAEWSSDNFYIDYAKWQSLFVPIANAYTWKKDILEGLDDDNWTQLYEQIFIANVVLDGLDEIAINATNSETDYKRISGMAFYLRAEGFFNLAQIFSQPYSASSASQTLGIPLRLNSNLNEVSVRPNLQSTYDRVIQDLHQAALRLPVQVDLTYKNRPSKATAYGLLSRVFLMMNDYTNAGKYADSCLNLYSTLLHFKDISPTTPTRPFPRMNPEVLTDCFIITSVSYNTTVFVDTSLYNSYASDDLRKTRYFKTSAGRKYFVGQYAGLTTPVAAITTDEMYLTRAECFARSGNIAAAMLDLNTLLINRWQAGTFVPLDANNQSDALNLILSERRKELVGRGLRWLDLRRLNQDPVYAKTLTRQLNGEIFTLPPNDPRYTFQIPEKEILLSGLQQNQR